MGHIVIEQFFYPLSLNATGSMDDKPCLHMLLVVARGALEYWQQSNYHSYLLPLSHTMPHHQPKVDL